jgi:tryptophan-rich sensory protein
MWKGTKYREKYYENQSNTFIAMVTVYQQIWRPNFACFRKIIAKIWFYIGNVDGIARERPFNRRVLMVTNSNNDIRLGF